MNYNKLISTLGRSQIKWTDLGGDIWIANAHALIQLNQFKLPPKLEDIAQYSEQAEVEIKKQLDCRRDKAIFTGIIITKKTKTLMAFVAERENGSHYPVFVDKKYIDLLGHDPISVYGTGNPICPLYYVGRSHSAFIAPYRVYPHDMKPLVNLIDLVDGKEEA